MSKTAGADRDGAHPLPSIPAKRYFTIGEVSDLCAVKPHVLRYWEQEFTQLKPVKRRGNRRYYQHHEVLLIRRIRELLYEEGFTINGARNRLDGNGAASTGRRRSGRSETVAGERVAEAPTNASAAQAEPPVDAQTDPLHLMRTELESIRALLARRAEDASSR
ncbi:MAG TPA: MerR family transcriptional regulator [Burkholderiaceae bacterium]|nr:MerR family transcriptional regulator [Burkholderiaceae bacterium]